MIFWKPEIQSWWVGQGRILEAKIYFNELMISQP